MRKSGEVLHVSQGTVINVRWLVERAERQEVISGNVKEEDD